VEEEFHKKVSHAMRIVSLLCLIFLNLSIHLNSILVCFELDQEFFYCRCLRECSTATCADRIHGTSWFHEVTKVELSQLSLIDGRMSIPGGSEMSKLLLRTGWVTLAYPRDNHLTCLFTDASDLHWGLESTQKISRNLSKNSDIDHFYE